MPTVDLTGLDLQDIEDLKKVKKERENLDLDVEEENKKWKPLNNILDLMIFIGIICLAIFSGLSLIGFIYALITGFPISDLWIILIIADALLFIGVIVLFLMILRAGNWMKFGLDLSRKKGDGLIRFTKSGKITFGIEKRARLMYFRPKDKLSRFFTTSKGYLEPSTGATFRTVKEDAPTDFDVNEEYKSDLEELSPLMNNRLEQEWDAGVNWNKTNQNIIMILVVIAMIAAVFSCILAIANVYLTGDKIDKMQVKIDGINTAVGGIGEKVEKIKNPVLDEQGRVVVS